MAIWHLKDEATTVMAELTIAGIDIAANDITVSLSASVFTEQRWLVLRQDILNARTPEGYRLSEVELVTGVRVVVGRSGVAYHAIPLNNDDAVLDQTRLYLATQLSIACTAADAVNLNVLQDLNAAHQLYMAERQLLLSKINDQSLSYDRRIEARNDYDALLAPNFAIAVQGLDTTGKWEYTETGGLNISYWTNGPYADLKIDLRSKTLVDL